MSELVKPPFGCTEENCISLLYANNSEVSEENRDKILKGCKECLQLKANQKALDEKIDELLNISLTAS